MIWLYRSLLPFLGILVMPYYAYRMIRRGGYATKFAYRTGGWPALPNKKNGITRLWIQAVSVGELSSLAKILDFLLSDHSLEIVLSGTTSTGLKMAAQKYGSRLLAHGPFPFDWLPFSRNVWKKINPDLVILVDSELWPEHFHQAKERHVPIIIVNARLSDLTFARLSSPFLRWAHPLIFPPNLRVIATSERQQARWTSLQFPSDRINISGNLKIDAVDRSLICPKTRNDTRKELGFSNENRNAQTQKVRPENP